MRLWTEEDLIVMVAAWEGFCPRGRREFVDFVREYGLAEALRLAEANRLCHHQRERYL